MVTPAVITNMPVTTIISTRFNIMKRTIAREAAFLYPVRGRACSSVPRSFLVFFEGRLAMQWAIAAQHVRLFGGALTAHVFGADAAMFTGLRRAGERKIF